MTRLAEDVLDRFKDGGVKCSTDHVQVVAQLYQALVEYLQELLEGGPSQPVRLATVVSRRTRVPGFLQDAPRLDAQTLRSEPSAIDALMAATPAAPESPS